MSEFNQKDLDGLRAVLEGMRPDINHDQYAVLDSVTLRIQELADTGIAPSIDKMDRLVCWAVLTATVDRLFRLTMEEDYAMVDEGMRLFNDTIDYLMEGK